MSLIACAQIVERADPDRFLAIMAAPPPARAVLWPIYAFNAEIARAPWVTAEPMIAEMRLQWWRDVLAGAEAGARPPDHEVAGPLARLIADRGLDVAALDRAVQARAWDIGRAPLTDAAALWAHLQATAGGVLGVAAGALGADAVLVAGVARAGRAGGLANWLMAVPALVARGRHPLPDAGPAAVADLARQGLADLAPARRLRPGPALPALRLLWRAEAILRQAARDPAAVAGGRLGGSEFRRRGSLLWATLRGGW